MFSEEIDFSRLKLSVKKFIVGNTFGDEILFLAKIDTLGEEQRFSSPNVCAFSLFGDKI